MDTHFGQWYSTANIDPDDELLKKRWEGIEAFSKTLAPSSLLELARLFHAKPPGDRDFEKAFRIPFFESDKAFKMQDNDIELAVLAGATLARVLSGKNRDHGVVAAFAIVCPSLQGKTKSATVPDVQNRARDYLASRSASLRTSAAKSRERISVPQIDELLNTISEGLAANTLPTINEPLTKCLQRLGTATQKVIKSVNKIQHDQLLYREESDMLWWVQGQHSRDLEVPIEQIDLAAASLVAGKELADITKVLPGPFSTQAFLHQILLREGSDIQSVVTLTSAINNSDREWRKEWAQHFAESETIDLCPILFAVKKSLETDNPKSWHAPFKNATKLSASLKIEPVALAAQAYEECLFTRAFNNMGEV